MADVPELATSKSIPIIDLRHLTRASCRGDTSAEVQGVARQLCEAFRTWGFAYVVNHRIPSDQIEAARAAAERFFHQTLEVKQLCERKGSSEFHGWVPLGTEKINPEERPGDYKEAFDAFDFDTNKWPDDVVPGLRPSLKNLNHMCQELLLDLLYFMAVGLGLKDEDVFISCHRFGQVPTLSCLRSIFYPAEVQKYKENQLACGEHTDYGSLTLVMQDDVGGLQVFDQTRGEYVDAPPIKDSIVVNIGDFMQRWTSDQLISTKHRVVMPDRPPELSKPRQSFVFFGQPEPDAVISCIDGSGKYPPITSLDYLQQKLDATF